MAFGVLFRSNLAFAIAAHHKIAENVLIAAANVVRQEAEKRAKRGMKSGKFVTPELGRNIFMDVDVSEEEAYVGTTVEHGLYWEEGHFNVVTNQYERVPWLTMSFITTKKEQAIAANKAANKTAKRFAGLALGRLAGLTPIGPLQSTIG